MRLLLPIVLLSLAACSRQPAPAEQDQTLLRTIEEPQQRAKAVEDDVLKASKRVDEELDRAAEAGRPAEPPPR